MDRITKSRQKLMLELLERRVRSRAQQIYDERGQTAGHDLEDWVQAESEVVKSSILAPLWQRRQGQQPAENEELTEV